MMSLEAVERLETDLRTAMLAGDVAALDRLLADDLIFTNQNGMTFGKSDDLDTHRSGLLKLDRLEPIDRRIRLIGKTATVVTKVELAGRYAGQPFAGSFVYTRVWRLDGTEGQVVVGHCSALG